ncbi:hypothetical protein ABXJ76_08335 [Methylobacter sp. G7]|uniref:hypothetical protein n=1 Tax=Methylobacter sp. G7 TaxID=3230117 RepID=UPI003D802D1C
MINDRQNGYVINHGALPEKFPTQGHDALFWESLGRAVATFGFLEEALTKAIFSFTATKPYEEHELQQAYAEWLPKLERTLSDTLGSLIDTFGKAVRDYPKAIIGIDELLLDLRNASKIRNVLCHGSWRLPDSNGASVPFFVNRQNEVFETAIDHLYINQVQRHATDLACSVINTVTHMGWQFPGSNGPGNVIWKND